MQRFSLLIGLSLLLLTLTAQAQSSIDSLVYTTQLADNLATLAEKYLNDPALAPAIRQATEAALESTLPEPIPPGTRLIIPAPAEALTWLPPPPTPTPQPTPTAIAGPPPGGKIAFSFYNRALPRRVWEINLINADGSNRQVWRWNEVSEPALSPDGQYLAFRGWSGFDFDTGRVLSVSPLNDPQRTWPVGSFQEDADPDWSHDGSRIVFASQRESDRLWRMHLVNGNGQDERQLARLDGMPLHGEDPAWSFRDNRIIYRGCSPQGEQCGLWFITLDGAVSAPIVVDPTAIQPDGSPSDDWLVFAAQHEGNWDVYRVNLDGSDLRRLTNDPGIDALPTFSPDGGWIAFQSTRPATLAQPDFEAGPSQGGQTVEGNWGLWLMRADGSDMRQIFVFDGGLMRANRLDLPYGARDWYDEQISWGW